MKQNYAPVNNNRHYPTKTNTSVTDFISFFATAKERQEKKHNPTSWALSLILLFTFLYTHISFSQTVTVPAGNTDSAIANNDPLGSWWGFERTALIYTSAQIGTTGTIDQVGFYLNSVSTPGASTNVRIYMKMRTTLMTAATTYATETTGATLVYGPTTITAGTFVTGWVTLPLATAFNYTGGTDNLEVIVETNATSTGSGETSSAKQFRCFTQASNQYYQNWNADNTAPVVAGTLSTARPNIQLHFAAPTITSLGSASGCPGSSITINGTNLTGATPANVKIGGTAVSSITSNTGTVLIAVVGAGATGTVAVTTAGGTATSAATFTVNAAPAAIGGGAATVCTGATTPAFTNATGGGTWSITAGTGTASISVGGVVTGLTAGTVTVVYTIGSCTPATQALTVTQNPAAIGGGATTVCTGATTAAFTDATGGGTWSITNSTGSATINAGGVATGVTAGTVTVVYTIGTCAVTKALTVNQTPVAIAGGAATVCTGLTTPAFTNASAGGTWSITAGTGTASISVGGVVTGLTAGTVTVVYTIGSCTPATQALTVNQNPAAIGGGATTVCTGAATVAFTDATGGGTWSITNGTGSATINAGGVATGVTAGTVTVVYTIGTCAVTKALTVITTPAITTNPSSSTIVAGANTSFTVVASNTPTSYTWEVSTNGGGSWSTVANGGVYTNATTATLNITAATIGMNGYMYRASATNTCGTSTASTSATLTITPTYCTSTGSTTADGITGVVFNTINNTGTAVNVTYSNYTAISTTLTKGNTYNLTAYINTGGNYTNYQSAWIDWNANGVFTDSGEFYNLGTALNVANGITSLCPYPITVPLEATTASVRMRIQSRYSAVTTGSCQTGFDGETEDYTLNIISDPAACTTPTAQPSALALSGPNGSSIIGSFTAASPAPTNYLVIVSTSAVAPAPSNGTAYAIGGTVGAGYTVVDNDGNTTFLANNLTPNTTYHIYVFSVNAICTGGPLYNTTSPLTGIMLTPNNLYCTPTTLRSDVYISGVASIGTLNDVSNTPTTYSPNGYGNYTGITIAQQIPGGGININLGLVGSAGQFIRAYMDWNSDGDFADANELVYTTGTTATGDTSFGFIVPGAQAAGNYRMRIRTKSFNEDSNIVLCTIGYVTGEVEDYTVNVQADCLQKVTAWTDGSACGPTSTVNLAAVSAGATGFRWYAAETGGVALADTPTGNWTTPSISATTIYYVTAYSGTCESLYRVPVTATIKTTSNITVTPSTPIVCGEGNIVQISATGDVVVEDLLVQDFESGLGTFTVTNPVTTNSGADTPWSVKTSTYTPTTTSVWKPAVNSGAVATTGNKFAFTTSDYSNSNIETRLITPVINAALYTDLTLTFDHYYSYYGGDSGNIEVSTDGGTTWIAPALVIYNSDLGSASKFHRETVNFNAYAGQSNLRFRFSYKGNWDDGWAIDNIRLFGTKPLNTTFTWSGGVTAFTDAGCTVPYVAQSVSTIYIQPTGAQISAASWSFTATATLSNGCPVTKNITVNNNTKSWQGTTTAWNDPNNWLPVGVPTASNCVVIPNSSIISGSSYNALAKNLTVKSAGNLELQSGNTITVTDWVNVNSGGIFNVRNNASLIQINNVANTGNINMNRIAANIDRLDYVYWSSPVTPFGSNAISPGTSTNLIWKWTPTIPTNTNGFGNWANGNQTMVIGKGYIVRGPNSYTVPANYTATFTGVPNNGDISIPISRGTYDVALDYNTSVSTTYATKDDDNWNLLGNPYPSAISAYQFMDVNTNIEGFIKIWTHGTPPLQATPDPFYNNYGYNYSAADYFVYNKTGSSAGSGTDYFIGAGQSFFVLMKPNTASTTENAVFNNSMRSSAYDNSQFYRTADTSSEEGRIWLDLVGTNSNVRTLVGYVNDATNNKDRSYDAIVDLKLNINLYSLIGFEGQVIQGRQLPFTDTDQVPLGIKVTQNGTYSIAIGVANGIFSNTSQHIYLEDKLLNIVHDLRVSQYSFTAAAGTYNERFVLRYTNTTLSNNDYDYANDVKIFANNYINITSSDQSIKEVIVYDILGKIIADRKNISKTEIIITDLKPTTNVLVVKVILDNNSVVVKKVIY